MAPLIVAPVTCVPSGPSDAKAVDEFLTAATQRPTLLVVDGEAGIGRTTFLLNALAEARERGFLVLAAQTAAAESGLSYAGLADLLGGVERPGPDLPDPQQRVLTGVLSHAFVGDEVAHWRMLAAAFLALVERLSEEAPVLVAIDDLQWLDAPSRQVLGFAARRLSSRVSVLATEPADRKAPGSASWLRLSRPDAVRRITIQPMSLSGLHELFLQRLQHSFARPTMERIHELSRGNPFHALELARQVDDDSAGGVAALPKSLSAELGRRINRLGPAVREVLLAAACACAPTVSLIADATGADAHAVLELLEEAETEGVIVIHGPRIQFSLPLLAHGVLSAAAPAQRRAMHRRLAQLEDEPEMHARHLALGATTVDVQTLRSLDAAAELARTRGAPAAAAELLDLAISLDGGDPRRRVRSAQHHFDAGELACAKTLLEDAIGPLAPGNARCEALHLMAMVGLYHESFPEAASLLQRALDEAVTSLALRARVQLTLAFSYAHLGQLDQGMRIAETAVNTAACLEQPELVSAALGMRIMLSFLRGDGVDEIGLRRALECDDPAVHVPLAFGPRVQQALILAWTGQLDEGRRRMLDIRRGCIKRGEESDAIILAFHAALIETWLGNITAAQLIAGEMVERAAQLGGDFARAMALIIRGLVGAYLGREHQSRSDISEGLAASVRCGSQQLGDWAITALGFLEVSLGDHGAALSALQCLCRRLVAKPEQTEIILAAFVPDAVEALTAVGHLDDATPLVDAMERNGSRLDRKWTLAVGARCRSLLCSARGDVDAAIAFAQCALTYHDDLAMPFEKARTQLLLGELQRRRRMKDVSATTLRGALHAFEELGMPLWANRARAALACANVLRLQTGDGLTLSERRIAELVAKGMTNRAIASTLFISPKTVEANLARMYRKLNIRSRAELARHVSQTPA
ncbi:LuxR C-terminal-related transcriptional regulator [Mycobacterium seoulense]|uniref:helix-turn-helix transcriptional regulator n=1 Tax=Mycobacterium seoulense TaxID=386911 RepID=UPI003CF764CB